MTMDITRFVLAFRGAVEAAWPSVSVIVGSDGLDSLLDDWLQANWERLVEANAGAAGTIALEPYGAGADCTPGSSRVWMPNMLPTHAVYVRADDETGLYDVVNDKPLGMSGQMSHFCSLVNGWPSIAPPFDHIALEGVEQSVVAIDNLHFTADPI